MGKKLILIIGAFIIIIILIPLIFYLFNQSQSDEKLTKGPNPTEEYQEFLEDTIITTSYFAILSCEDCDGVETALSLSQEEKSDSGTFVISKTRLGTSENTEVITGDWNTQEFDESNGTYIVLNYSDEDEKFYLLSNAEENLTKVDEKGNEILINGEKIVLKLL